MKPIALLAIAGIAPAASAQFVTITIDTTDLANTTVVYEVNTEDARLDGALGFAILDAGLGFSGAVTSDVEFTHAFDGSLPRVTGLGTNDFTFEAGNFRFDLGMFTRDFSNPIQVGTFHLDAIPDVRLIANSVVTFGTPGDGGFGEIHDYDANDARVIFIPTPATTAILPIAALAATRRRR